MMTALLLFHAKPNFRSCEKFLSRRLSPDSLPCDLACLRSSKSAIYFAPNVYICMELRLRVKKGKS